jgi:hypothetical protein
MNLANLSNDELLVGIHSLAGQGRQMLARLLAYLGEVEERRLDLQSACSSLFDFCLRRLGMSEDEAYRRVAAARIARSFPVALGMIERGEIHLTGLLMLREHLSPEQGEALLHAAAGKTKSELQHLLAERFPRPDAPSRLQLLTAASASFGEGARSAAQEIGAPSRRHSSSSPGNRSRIEPLAPARYRVEFTASAELRDKLQRAADLLRHANPSGDLAVLVERALDTLLPKLEKQRLAKVTRPVRILRSASPLPSDAPAANASTANAPVKEVPSSSTRPGYVPRAVRRAVLERDGERCAFVDEKGRRCEARTWLELDHRVPRAVGGADDSANLSVRCRAHNGLAAECFFGRGHIERKVAERRAGQRATHEDDERPAPAASTAPAGASARGAGSLGRASANKDDAQDRSAHPRQRGPELTLRALCNLGFRPREARRALSVVEQRFAGSEPRSVETWLREALDVLA